MGLTAGGVRPALARRVRRARALLAAAELLDWPHGAKTVALAGLPASGGGGGGWLPAWSPTSSAEVALVLTTDARLSPAAYEYAKELAAAYLLDGSAAAAGVRLFGATLLRLQRPPVTDNTHNAMQQQHLFLSQAVGESVQLLAPGPWKQFRAWLYASQAASVGQLTHFGGTDKGIAAAGCQPSWMASFAAYVHQLGYYNLHLNLLGEPSLAVLSRMATVHADNASDGSDSQSSGGLRLVADTRLVPNELWTMPPAAKLPKYGTCMHEVHEGTLAETMEELAALLARLHRNGTVIVVTVNAGFEDVMANWLCHVKDLGLRHRLLVAVNLPLAQRLADAGEAVLYLQAASELVSDAGLVFATIEYQQLILQRTKMIDNILALGYSVLLADIDAVWLSDPFPHMADPSVELYAQVEPSGLLCGGFLYLRNTVLVRQLWAALTERHAALLDRLAVEARQPSIEDHEQSMLNEMLRDDPSFTALIVRKLDPLLFPSGFEYWQARTWVKRGVTPVVVHNNWINGKEAKLQRFREAGLWRVRDADLTCICRTCPIFI
eukprot:SM000044S16053  [mRNA]  locus=s44:717872:720690:- [translate_table: standard]